MESLPLALSFVALGIWAVSCLALRPDGGAWSQAVALGLSLVQLGGAIWAAVRVLGESAPVRLSLAWLGPTAALSFDFGLSCDPASAVVWVVMSLVLCVATYWSALSGPDAGASASRGQAFAVPLLGVCVIVMIGAADLLTFFIGFTGASLAGFLSLGLAIPSELARTRAAVRYFVLNMAPWIVFLSGLLGAWAEYGGLGFDRIAESAAAGGPSWPVICLVLGGMWRNMQLPLMQCARYLSVGGASARPVFFLAHAVPCAVLFGKLWGPISTGDWIRYLALIPALTSWVAAVAAMPERNPDRLAAWLVAYVCGAVFAAGLVGDYMAAQALAFTGSIGAFLVVLAVAESGAERPPSRWLPAAAVLFLVGVPGTGWEWSRYLEYLSYLAGEDPDGLRIAVLVLRVLADLSLGMALWGIARQRLLSDAARGKWRWERAAPLVLLAIVSLAGVVGGRPLGGVAGAMSLDLLGGEPWFEQMIRAAGAGARAQGFPSAFGGTEADILARCLVFGVLLIPALLGNLWLFRDRARLGEYHARAQRLVGWARISRDDGSFLWDGVLRPTTRALGAAVRAVDVRLIEFVTVGAWGSVIHWARRAFRFFEGAVLDARIIDGAAEVLGTVGKSLRLVHNGQAQFYLGAAVAVMAAVLWAFSS